MLKVCCAGQVVSEDGEEFYSVAQMADLLFNEGTPAACYAAHRLLNEDRTYFKQVGRAPPMFQARPEREVVNLRQQAEALRKVADFFLALPYPPPQLWVSWVDCGIVCLRMRGDSASLHNGMRHVLDPSRIQWKEANRVEFAVSLPDCKRCTKATATFATVAVKRA